MLYLSANGSPPRPAWFRRGNHRRNLPPETLGDLAKTFVYVGLAILSGLIIYIGATL